VWGVLGDSLKATKSTPWDTGRWFGQENPGSCINAGHAGVSSCASPHNKGGTKMIELEQGDVVIVKTREVLMSGHHAEELCDRPAVVTWIYPPDNKAKDAPPMIDVVIYGRGREYAAHIVSRVTFDADGAALNTWRPRRTSSQP
jgi:hypothetical protein